MKTSFLQKWLTAALGVLILGATAARAEADSFGLGTGRNGPLNVTASGTIINSYAPVTGALRAGDISIPTGACYGDPTCFTAGDLVMVYQATGLSPVPASGDQTPVSLGDNPVGRWEFARLASATTSALGLTAPLVHAYAANVTQVIRVPEYTSVTIPNSRSITAVAWNGSVGGIVAFLANDVVENNGQITASGLGFRGGQYVNQFPGASGCSGLDEPAPRGGQKGEGIANARYGTTHTGRGNVANGAGGGVCFKSGGGGGGNGGVGGQGGRSENSDGRRAVGGLGGTALTYSILNHLTFGGGGGAGHGSDNTGVPGGNGGGAIFIRANQLTGTLGSITASGGAGGSSGSDGGSGGGAGGTIYLRVVSTAECVSLYANGGIGGSVNAVQVGPGGGGGGGRVLFQAAGGSCGGRVSATGATAGNQLELSDPTYGAQAGGSVAPTVLPGGFIVPPVPTVLTPVNGSLTNNPRPAITGTALADAEVIIYLDGNEVGRTRSDAAGNYSFTPPTNLSDGDHTVLAVVEVEAVRSARSASNTFTVDTLPPDTTIVSGPSGSTRELIATFEFSATEAQVTYECSLDGAEFTPCASRASYPELAEGEHTLRVRARDAAGNVDATPDTRTFRTIRADLALLGSGYGCSAGGQDASWVLMGLGAFAALVRRRSRP